MMVLVLCCLAWEYRTEHFLVTFRFICVSFRRDWGALIIVDDRFVKTADKYRKGICKLQQHLSQNMFRFEYGGIDFFLFFFINVIRIYFVNILNCTFFVLSLKVMFVCHKCSESIICFLLCHTLITYVEQCK